MAVATDGAGSGAKPHMDNVSVIGSRLHGAGSDVARQVSILDSAQIQLLNKADVEQLLHGLPGVNVNRQGGAGGITSLYVRGGEANFTVVMLDGVPLNNPTNTRGGSFDFSNVDISTIERIELIRGPQSVAYRADALSGVVNLISRGADADTGTRVRGELGTDGYYRGTAYLGQTLGEDGHAGIFLGRNDAGNVVDASEHEIEFVNARVILPEWATNRVGATVYYSESERMTFPEDSGGPEYAVFRDRDEARSEDLSAQLSWQSGLGRRWQSTVTANWFRTEGEATSPGIFPGTEVPPSGSDTTFDRYQLSWNNRFQFKRTHLSAGLDAQREDGESEGFIDFGVRLPTDFELERDTVGAFAEVTHQFTDGLSLSIGARHDNPDGVDSQTTWRLGGLYRFADGRTALRANWGEGFKLPSFFALAHPLVGNPDLKPETANSWDMGIEHRFQNGLAANVALFGNRFEDLVDFDDEAFMQVNRSRVDTHGIELGLRLPLGSKGSISGHATWLETDIDNTDEELRGRPDWKAGALFLYDLGPRVSFSAEYLRVGEVVEASRHTGVSVDQKLDAYDVVDVGLIWRFARNAEVQLAVDNLFDEDYRQAVGFPAAGISPRLAVELRL